MVDAMTGEIRANVCRYAPQNWMMCNGQSLSMNDYQQLYSLIGTTYGGSGNNFNLPNLNGRVITKMGQGTGVSNYALAQTVGAEGVTVAEANLPAHTHTMTVSNIPGTVNNASNNFMAPPVDLANANTVLGYLSYNNDYTPAPTIITENSASITSSAGGNQPHENRQPYFVMTYMICVDGLYPQFP